MKAILQRVTSASVEVDGTIVGQIGAGLLVLLGVAKGDGEGDCRCLVEKLRTFRIFSDEQGKMNRSLVDVGGSVLLVSQFTLLGSTANGRRPSFDPPGWRCRRRGHGFGHRGVVRAARRHRCAE